MSWTIEPVSDGSFLADGGTMFGIVPRILWEKLAAPDALNRIQLHATCYLLRDGLHTVLIEAGLGELTEKERAIHGVDRSARRLPDRLRDIGVPPQQVDFVLLSHLHFDHAGWCTRWGADGRVTTFPNARYVVQQAELDAATRPSELSRREYQREPVETVARSGQWQTIEGGKEVLPGLRAVPTGGHTAHHQAFLIDSAEGRCWFPGDLIPTRHHLKLPYVTAYDLYPVQLARRKREFLRRAEEADWRVLWYHDDRLACSRLRREQDGALAATGE